jgi:outer membrane lipoprotein-sorting protein
MRGRNISLMTGLSLAALLGVSAASQAAPKTAIFNVTAVHGSMNGQVTIKSKVWVTPTKARAEVKHPLEGDQTFLVTNGFLYVLDPKGKRGLKDALPPEVRKKPDNFDLLVSKFAFDASGPVKMSKKVRTETVSGFLCDVLTHTMKQGEASRTITVWMPQTMSPKFAVKAVLNEKLTSPGANLDKTTTITLSDIKLGTTVPASTFVVPTGYKFINPKQGAAKPAAKRGKR